jgi:hypothetical protein
MEVMMSSEPSRRYESEADRQIRLAREAGVFDSLSGVGLPLPGLDDPDEDWWIKEKLRREQVALELPPALAIRQAKRELLELLPTLADESDVRQRLEALNERILRVNRVATSGPPSTTTMVDINNTLREWHAHRSDLAEG